MQQFHNKLEATAAASIALSRLGERQGSGEVISSSKKATFLGWMTCMYFKHWQY
jgi:hypothetical protein